MAKNRNKKSKKKSKYFPDVISYYANNNGSKTRLTCANPEEIHGLAEQIFGTSYYINFDTLSKDAII